ncbi:hypothetical protein GCM10022239_15160 [Leifsonia bigeumensis]|uniref:Alternate-type signal peptide domain-containing protein n=1 Tax=Leifsonella bigeumensis TaxID=433643 RepID=A0ABP7FIF5_9MICO
MNKLTKAAIAGAAGIALLLGGAGSLAYWNDSTSLAGGTINAGQLQITADPDGGVWTDADGDPVDLATFLAVPGDALTYTDTFTLMATGDNLSATLALAPTSITPASSDSEDVALAALLSSSAVFTVDSVTTSTVTANAGTQTVDVAVTITWPDGTSTTDNAAQLGSVVLANMSVVLTQVV